MNELKANKGEWSEFYTLVKLLSEWQLFPANEDLKKYENIGYPIIKIISQKNTKEENEYSLKDKKTIKVFSKETNSISTLPLKKVKSKVSNLFKEIKEGDGSSYAVDSAKELIKDLGCKKIKAESLEKSDIFLVIHDFKTTFEHEVGFNIKSQLGGKPTLLNASGATNFTFKINLKGDIKDINKISGVREKLKYILKKGGSLSFLEVDNRTFESNLRRVDSFMPEMIAEILKNYYSGEGSTISELTDRLEKDNPLLQQKFIKENGDYEYKISNLLEKVALGMVPSKKWDGNLQTNGGYIIVREDGELVCYHLYNLDQFRKYLLKNTKLETPSTSRHNFGEVYFDPKGKPRMKLNLQIRFND